LEERGLSHAPRDGLNKKTEGAREGGGERRQLVFPKREIDLETGSHAFL